MRALHAAIALTFLTPFANADLGPGSPAPSLTVKAWYKGEPVKEIGNKGTYVVEFWATWCGPCIDSIPHLTELAHKNPDVAFIGVSIWEDGKDGNIKKFVDKMGDKMDYHVGYSGNKEGMSATWMKASGQSAIPTAFIVKDGVVMWIGHPDNLEGPLEQVKSGALTIEKSKEEFVAHNTQGQKIKSLLACVRIARKLFDEGKRKEAHAKLNEILKVDPDWKNLYDVIAFRWLSVEDPKAWQVKAEQLGRSNDSLDLATLDSFIRSEMAKPTIDEKSLRHLVELTLHAQPDLFAYICAVDFYAHVKDYKKAVEVVNLFMQRSPDNREWVEARKQMKEKLTELEPKSK